jgi:SAM-dependent methyltransferase
MTGRAGYDAHADWYDAYVTGDARRHTARTTAALCATVGPGAGVCLDIGCGTGVHAAGLRSIGWDVVGVDLSLGQLRHARRRLPVAVADAARLPVATSSVDVAVAVLVHTDVPDWSAAVREAARVLRPGGRFVSVGVHPCFVGPFAEVVDDQVRIHPGYDDGDLTFEGPGLGSGIRPRVGVRHVALAGLVNAVLQAGLVLTRLEEPADGPTPDLLVLDATAPPHT